MQSVAKLDALIIGGGIAGLWTLRALVDAGYDAALLESKALGAGQSIAAQGIIHGGLKYTLRGALTGSAKAIREAPAMWRSCFAGEREPRLTATAIRAQSCFVWRTESLSSRAAMVGAQRGLRVKPEAVAKEDRPAALESTPGVVARVAEQVVDPARVLEALSAPAMGRTALYDDTSLFVVEKSGIDGRWVVQASLADGKHVVLAPGVVVIAAGAGTAALRGAFGLAPTSVQTRPLHMVMVRGSLPTLNGHCVDGLRTRVTITTSHMPSGETVWQVGGQIAEDGVAMDEVSLIEHARRELRACLPDVDIAHCAVATYRVDRVEGKTRTGARPEAEVVTLENRVVTALPTKLALAPRLAQRVTAIVRGALDSQAQQEPVAVQALEAAPHPRVAQPPWERVQHWRN